MQQYKISLWEFEKIALYVLGPCSSSRGPIEGPDFSRSAILDGRREYRSESQHGIPKGPIIGFRVLGFRGLGFWGFRV